MSDEGKLLADQGSYEARVFSALPAGPVSRAEFQKSAAFTALGKEGNIGFSKAVQNGWIALDGDNIVKKTDTITDSIQQHLRAIIAEPASAAACPELEVLKKRKLLAQKVIKSVNVAKGRSFSLTIEKAVADLTPEMLADGSWKTAKFKQLNLDALGKPVDSGYLHPLLKVRAEYREIFLEMGFSEMPTNNYVERSGTLC